MTPFESLGYTNDQKFKVTKSNGYFEEGDIIQIKRDDGSDCPWFWTPDKQDYWAIHLNRITPVEERKMTPCEKKGYKVGQVFKDKRNGELFVLHVDDESNQPICLSLKEGFLLKECVPPLRYLTRIYPPEKEPKATIETITLMGKEYNKAEIENALKDVMPIGE